MGCMFVAQSKLEEKEQESKYHKLYVKMVVFNWWSYLSLLLH